MFICVNSNPRVVFSRNSSSPPLSVLFSDLSTDQQFLILLKNQVFLIIFFFKMACSRISYQVRRINTGNILIITKFSNFDISNVVNINLCTIFCRFLASLNQNCLVICSIFNFYAFNIPSHFKSLIIRCCLIIKTFFNSNFLNVIHVYIVNKISTKYNVKFKIY